MFLSFVDQTINFVTLPDINCLRFKWTDLFAIISQCISQMSNCGYQLLYCPIIYFKTVLLLNFFVVRHYMHTKVLTFPRDMKLQKYLPLSSLYVICSSAIPKILLAGTFSGVISVKYCLPQYGFEIAFN